MSDAGTAAQGDPRSPLVERLSGTIAVIGGIVSLCMALLVVVSVIGRRFYNSPVNGDFEIVQIASAIAVFTFLPYCQVRRSNIVVDTFTTWLPARTNSLIDAFWDLVYAGMMGLMTTCLVVGTLEHYRTGQTTMLLQLLVWPAIAVCTVLSALLTLVALVTAVQLIRERP